MGLGPKVSGYRSNAVNFMSFLPPPVTYLPGVHGCIAGNARLDPVGSNRAAPGIIVRIPNVDSSLFVGLYLLPAARFRTAMSNSCEN